MVQLLISDWPKTHKYVFLSVSTQISRLRQKLKREESSACERDSSHTNSYFEKLSPGLCAQKDANM